MNDLSLIFAEKQLLSYLLTHIELTDSVRVSLFCTDTGKAVYTAIKRLYAEGVTLSPNTILTELSTVQKTVKPDVIQGLFQQDVSDADFLYLKKAVEMAGVQYQLQQSVLPDLVNMTSAKSDFDFGEARDLLRKSLQILDSTVEAPPIYGGEQLGNLYENILNERRSGNYFFSSGDSYLDSRLTIGFAPGTQTVIFGTTGSGKTNFALSLFLKMIHKKIPCLYVSLEMPVDMLIDRLFASKYQLPLDWLYPQSNEYETVPDWVFEKLELFKTELKQSKLFRIVDEATFSISDLEELIVAVKKEMNVAHLNVFVDLTTMLQEFTNAVGSRADNIEIGVNQLNAIAKKHKCHIINIVQSNRQQDSMRLTKLDDIDKLRPTLNHIKSSNALAERARLVLGVFRKKYYAERYFPNEVETETMDDVMQVSILKQSQGALGELTYLFAGKLASVFKFNQAEPIRRSDASDNKTEDEEESSSSEEV